MRLLLIEDDAMLGRALAVGLSQDQHAIDYVRTVKSARETWFADAPESCPYEAALVDLGLPDGSGLDLVREARKRGYSGVIVIITARTRVVERIAALDAGADDYMLKPVDLEELSARLRAITRRIDQRRGDHVSVGPLHIDLQRRTVTLHDAPVLLTAQEFAVLWTLARRPGSIVSRSRIEDALYPWEGSIDSNTIEVQIHRLRRKLGTATIETHRGLGYRLCAPGTA